jgi:hypothetical protein
LSTYFIKYYCGSHIKEDERGEACSTQGEINVNISVGKPQRERLLRKPWQTWKIILMDLKGTECEGMKCIDLDPDRDLCWALMNTVKREEFLDQLRDYQLLKKDSAPWSWL